MRLRPMGESAFLAELPDAAATLDLYRRLAADRPAGVQDVVPAARTVLVTFHPGVPAAHRTAAEHWLRAAASSADQPGAASDAGDVEPSGLVRIAVRYGGPDLEEVGALLGISVDDVIAAHTGTVWAAAFIGFAPGFAYLQAPDGRLDVPRRSSPRSAVPAGSVALAAGYCGVYPRESPGGWHLIGTTDAVLWDADRPRPALLAPGTEVEFHRA
jgi:KipI family sensor histidine kinase inhibitor